jgi:four helix bundle protein
MPIESYRHLDVYELSFTLAVEAHRVSLRLPKFELYEEGSQLRRAAKSIPANIAEGFGRRHYKNEYIRFLIYALASCDEVRVHLDMLHETGSLPQDQYEHLSQRYETLGRKLNRFLQRVITGHLEPYRDYSPVSSNKQPATSTQ